MDKKVIIDVGGKQFRTTFSCLQRLPSTKLAQISKERLRSPNCLKKSVSSGEILLKEETELNSISEQYETNKHTGTKSENEELFFNRNPLLFDSILDAYRRGTVHFPHDVCSSFVQEELEYWGIPETCLAPCCWHWYMCAELEKEKRKELEKVR